MDKKSLHVVPNRHATEMRRFYQKATGDLIADERTIAAHVARLQARKRQMIEWRAQGLTLKEISEIDGHAHPATLSTYIRRAFQDVRKEIDAERSAR